LTLCLLLNHKNKYKSKSKNKINQRRNLSLSPNKQLFSQSLNPASRLKLKSFSSKLQGTTPQVKKKKMTFLHLRMRKSKTFPQSKTLTWI